MLLILN
jgi:hypothetical protein